MDELKDLLKLIWYICYTYLDSAKANLEEIRKFAMKNNTQAVLKKFNKKNDIISFSEEVFEKGKNKAIEAQVWKAGVVSESKQLKKVQLSKCIV